MAETPSHSAREWRGYRWTQRDLLLVGNTGLVCGIVAAGVGAIRPVLLAHTGLGFLSLLLIALATNIFLFPSLFTAAWTRRISAAVTTQLLVALVIVLLTPLSWRFILDGLFVGLLCEGAFALTTRYRRTGVWSLALAGLLVGVVRSPVTFLGHPVAGLWSPVMVAIVLTTVGVAAGYGALAAYAATWFQRRAEKQ
ncbi:MAG: ECF transporter S component [Chloroflexales bacterium]|nr:ECF transporter S component [Chloroflexales bacterium]